AVTSREDERIDRLLLGFGVNDKLETLREERSNHQLELARTLPRNRWTGCSDLVLNARINLRDDVEMVGRDPARPTGNLKVLELIRIADQQAERDIGGREAARLVPQHDAAVARVVRLDRRDLERGGIRTGLGRLSGQRRHCDRRREGT